MEMSCADEVVSSAAAEDVASHAAAAGRAGQVVDEDLSDDGALAKTGASRSRVPSRHIVASSACFRGSASHVDEGADCSGIACTQDSDGDSRSTAEFSADIERDNSHSGPSHEFAGDASLVAVDGGN